MEDSPLTENQAEAILAQMKSRNLQYEDFWAEYYTGIASTYAWDPGIQEFVVRKLDVVAGSFSEIQVLARKELLEILLEAASPAELEEQGFVLPSHP